MKKTIEEKHTQWKPHDRRYAEDPEKIQDSVLVAVI